MRRPLLTLAIAAVFGLALTAGEASACHKKKKCATPCPEPVACVPAPMPCPEPVACAPAPKKKCFGGMKMFGHKKNKAACVETASYEAAPAYHHSPAPVYSSGQSIQASGQGY